MSGHFEKRRNKDGTISWRVSLPTGYGRGAKRAYRTFRASRDSDDPPRGAFELLDQMKLEAAGGGIAPQRLRVSELLKQWLEQGTAHLSPRTLYGYRRIVETHLAPALGDLRTADLRPRHLSDLWADEREEGFSASTVRSHYRVLHIALGWALRMELVTRNVADAARPPQGKAAEMQTISAARLLGLCDLAVDTPLELWVLIAAGSGARRSEVEAVRVRDLDLKRSQATIARTMEHTPGEPVEPRDGTKSLSRTVPLPPFATERLKMWKAAELRQPGDYVCPRVKSHRFSPLWADLTKRAELPGFRFHDIRHSVATILLESGLPVKVVQEILGHTTPTTTMNVYAHVTERMRDMAAAAVSEAFRVTPDSLGNPLDGEVLALSREKEHA